MKKLIFILLLVSNTCLADADLVFNIKHGREFGKWASIYTPTVDPAWFQAQAKAESRYKENAVSPVKAAGLMQIMPKTFKEIAKETKTKGFISAFNPEISIQFGIYYMSKQLKIWKSKDGRTPLDQLQLAQASYNAGAGSVIASQEKCGGVKTYSGVIACLPKVTGKHSKETIGYVVTIAKFKKELDSKPLKFKY